MPRLQLARHPRRSLADWPAEWRAGSPGLHLRGMHCQQLGVLTQLGLQLQQKVPCTFTNSPEKHHWMGGWRFCGPIWSPCSPAVWQKDGKTTCLQSQANVATTVVVRFEESAWSGEWQGILTLYAGIILRWPWSYPFSCKVSMAAKTKLMCILSCDSYTCAPISEVENPIQSI